MSKSVRFENDRAQSGFTQVANALLRDAELSVPARLLWALLASYAWQDERCWPGQEGLAGMMGLSDRSVRSYLRELEREGLIETRRRGLGQSNETVIRAMSRPRMDRKPASDQTGSELPTKKTQGEEDSVPPKKKGSTTEPIGFAEWLGKHVAISERHGLPQSVPRAGTSARADLAGKFAALMFEGYSLEEFELASEGVLADQNMRDGGWIKPENVLRKTKFAGRVDAGRRARLERGGEGDGQGSGKWD